MVVSTAAWSQNTSRPRSASVSSACHSAHSSRACRTSSRRCSAACSVFFTGQAELLQGAADGGTGAAQAQAVADLLQGEVGLLGEELAELLVARRGDGGRPAPGVGAWLQRAGFGAEHEVVRDAGDGGAGQGGDGGQGDGAVVLRGGD